MYRAMLGLSLLLLPACAHADGVYQIRPLTEGELMTIYTSVMRDACTHANQQWHTWSVDPGGGYWGNGISDGNEGIRAVAGMVITCSALLKYSDDLTAPERRDYIAKATAAIRYVVATHVTGTQTCVDGKKWGGSWQSAYWTGTWAFGTWLMWDHLDAGLRQGVERVVAFEADRFLAVKPPSGRWSDTKAEENGWDLTCIAVAATMFPTNAHAAAWDTKAKEYMMNTLSVARDRKDNTLVDGRPVSEWVCTENLHPDFTLENHNIFHLSYVQCSSYFLTQSVMYYAYARRPVPQAATHHLMDTWRMFQTVLLPCGETAFPQGMDWELHNLPAINLFASLGTYMKDPVAAESEKIILQYMRAWQKWCGGDLAVPGSGLGFTRHSIQAEQTTYGYLAHKIFGPATQDKPVSPPSFVRCYSSVDVIMHRTGSKLVSFSWKNRIMGQILPIGEGHLADPFFIIPIANGLIGSMELSAAKDAKVKVLERAWKRTSSGFETTGVLLTDGGLLKQTLKVSSVGEKAVVYQDRVSAQSDVSVTRELGVGVGIENDRITGGTRVVYHRDGETVFDWSKPQAITAVPGPWANVDGRLGVVTAAGSGFAYSQAGKYNGQGVYADILYASFSDTAKQFKAGDEVARRIVLFFVEVTPQQTSELSRSVKIEDTPGGKALRFSLPEGGEGRVLLL